MSSRRWVALSVVLLCACRSERKAAAWSAEPGAIDPVPAAPGSLPDARRAPDGTLAVAWEYPVPPGRAPIFPGVASPDGTIYGIEIADVVTGAGEVLALRADGAERWRAAIPYGSARASPGAPEEALLLAGRLVVVRTGAAGACARDARLVALRADDGAFSWAHAFAMDLPEPRDFQACSATASAPAATDSAVVIAVTRCPRPGRCDHAVEALDLASGARRWSVALPELPAGTFAATPAIDERGNAYVLAGTDPARRLVSVSAAGTLRYDVAAPAGTAWLAAAAAGVLVAPPAILDASTGRERASLGGSALAVLAGKSAYAVVDRSAVAETTEELVRLPLGSAAPAWTVPVGRIPTSGVGTWSLAPLLTEEGTLLVCSTDFETGFVPTRTRAVLREVDVDGIERLRVDLPDAGRDRYETGVLLEGRWIALVGTGWEPFGAPPAAYAIRAFDLPGRRPLGRGWNGAGGSAGGDRRAR